MKLHGMSIGKKLLVLIMAGSLMAFLALGGLSFYAMLEIHDELDERGKNLARFAEGYTGGFAEVQTKRTLSDMTRLHAQEAEIEISQIRNYATLLAGQMTHIMTHPEAYKPRYLPNSINTVIRSGDCYVHHGTKLIKSGINDSIAQEIALASNIADSLSPMMDFYSSYRLSFFAGSKNNYMICMDIIPYGNHVVEMTREFFTDYDIVTRPWYIAAERAGKATFTDVYVGIEGYPAITCAVPYYDAQGLAGVVGVDGSIESIYHLLSDKSVGESETSFILDCATGDVLMSSREHGVLSAVPGIQDLRKSDSEQIVAVSKEMIVGKSGIIDIKVDGEEYYLSFAPMDQFGWSYGILLEKSEVMEPYLEARKGVMGQIDAFRDTLRSMFLGVMLKMGGLVLVLIVIMYCGSAVLTKRFSMPILQLSDGVKDIAQGNLDRKLDIHTGDEIEHLAICFNAMTDELKKYMADLTKMTSERERISTELDVAKGIQAGMLPNVFPPFPERKEFDIFASMTPAKYVAGDFYDFYMVGDHHLMVTVADVSDNGVPAALFMMKSRTVLENYAVMMHSEEELSGVMACANRRLCQNNVEGMFVTALIGMLDIETGEFVYVSGGHCPPLVGRKQEDGSRSFEFIPMKRSCMLGIDDSLDFPQLSLRLEPGDIIILYTNGLTETTNVDGEYYTSDRLKEVLNRTPGSATAEEVVDLVKKDVGAHSTGAERYDDITLLGLVFLGS